MNIPPTFAILDQTPALGLLAFTGILFLCLASLAFIAYRKINAQDDAESVSSDLPASPLFEIPPIGVLLDENAKVVCMGDDFRQRFTSGLPKATGQSIATYLPEDQASELVQAITDLRSGDPILEKKAASLIRAVKCPFGEERYLALCPEESKRILITDDQETYRSMVASYLRKRGYEVEEEAHGAEAVEKIRQWKPQLVLMDLNMPGMSGFEACRQARLAEPEGTTRIIAVSGLTGKGLHERCLASGIDRFVSKPLDLPHLEGVIEEQFAVILAA